MLDVEPDIDDEDADSVEPQSQAVPDDLELPCGCHFHWYDAPSPTGLFARLNLRVGSAC